MRRSKNELERDVPLILVLGVWLLVLGMVLTALLMLVPAVSALAGERGELAILGVNAVVESDAGSIAGSVGVALVALGFGALLVYECSDTPVVSRAGREAAQPLEVPHPPVLRLTSPGPVPGGRAAEVEELLSIDGDAYAASFMPNGSLVTQGDGGMRLWDLEAGEELLHLPDAGGLAALSPDGQHVAVQRGSVGIVLRSLSDGAERTIVHRSSPWKSGFGGLSQIAFSPDGRRLASAGDPDTRVWSVADGSELLRIPTGPTEFYGVIMGFSPDGRYLATTATERTVDVWDSSDGRRIQRFDHRPHRYARVGTGVAFSPDSRRLATLCSDGSAWIWDVECGRLLLALTSEGAGPCNSFDPRTLAWSPDGTRLFIPWNDGTASAWDTATGVELLCFRHEDPPPRPRGPLALGMGAGFGVSIGPMGVAVSPDGTLLATSGPNATVKVFALA